VLAFLFMGINIIASRALPQPGPFMFRAMLLVIAWLAYIFSMSFTGIFTNFSLPPRIPLFLVLPFLVFLIYFFTSVRFKPVIDQVPLNWPVYFQSFRIGVELLIFISFTKGILPHAATYEGYNFDIVTGLTAPIIGYMLYKNVRGSRTIALIWNIIGLLLLANVVVILNTCAYFPKLWGSGTSLIKPDYGLLPLALLAGIFMPAAVFMHVLSITGIVRAADKKNSFSAL
jgi:hypothetical protein